MIIRHPLFAPLIPRDVEENAFTAAWLLGSAFRYPSRLTFQAWQRRAAPQRAGSAAEPGRSCVVEVIVASLICGALRVRGRLRLSPKHWADLSSLQPEEKDSVYTLLLGD